MIVESPDPVLRKRAIQVDKVDPWIKKTLGKMEKIVEVRGALGLAAPQIAISQTFFVMRRNDGTFLHVVNPTITPVTDERETQEESCLSMPGIAVPVSRYAQVFLDYIDENGEPQMIRLSGMEARCAQHEYDHLCGVLIVDYIDGNFKNVNL